MVEGRGTRAASNASFRVRVPLRDCGPVVGIETDFIVNRIVLSGHQQPATFSSFTKCGSLRTISPGTPLRSRISSNTTAGLFSGAPAGSASATACSRSSSDFGLISYISMRKVSVRERVRVVVFAVVITVFNGPRFIRGYLETEDGNSSGCRNFAQIVMWKSPLFFRGLCNLLIWVIERKPQSCQGLVSG